MSCCSFAPSLVQPGAAAQDPTKHVHYELGMVLGVDDLNQEFAYLSQRDQWITRDLLGYGTVWGLAVSARGDGLPSPELVVSSGVAVNPRGQLIRVAPAQCAALNPWLAAHAEQVRARRLTTAVPNLFQVPLYLVLSYRTCLTDPVPIAGQPCRSENDATKPSRAADDFLLELSFDPPPQQEEDAVRAFARWLREHITVGGSAPSLTIDDWLASIRAAADAAATVPSSPLDAQTFLVDSSPAVPLQVPAALLPDYLRAALRLWVTELRPRWRPSWLGDQHGCAGTGVVAAADQGNQLLLAAVSVPIVETGLNTNQWQVSDFRDIVIDEAVRPLHLHLRLLQEWLLTESAGGASPIRSSAAGIVVADGTPSLRSAVSGLRVVTTSGAGSAAVTVTLSFDGYSLPPAVGGPQYIVKALPWPGTPLDDLSVHFRGFQAGGFALLLRNGGANITAADLGALQLMVEVSEYA